MVEFGEPGALMEKKGAFWEMVRRSGENAGRGVGGGGSGVGEVGREN